MSNEKIQVRCIGCQAIGYVPREGWADRPCPKCGCALTDWVKIPTFRVTKTVPKASDPFSRGIEHLDGDMRELNGTGTDYSGSGRPKSVEDRDDFRNIVF